ncbi:MAG: preprotein translocase subunit YajC [Chromatiales bacterium]|jgi:preprotein translocase subunit YajC|nr:preprotein translocase subunit YajC [Chromatiales bacterium]
MDFFIQSANAQGIMDGGADLMGLAPLVLIFVVFYFLLIRPQTKRQKEHREMVAAISAGNEVVTAGGVLGKVVKVADQFVIIEIADGVEVAAQKHTLGAVMPKGTVKSARSGKAAPKQLDDAKDAKK